MKAFRITTPSFDKKEHIVHATSGNRAKYKLGLAIANAGWTTSPVQAIIKYVESCKRAPDLDNTTPTVY
jgi:hypothetical protein